mgnify:CR=1 FL=1
MRSSIILAITVGALMLITPLYGIQNAIALIAPVNKPTWKVGDTWAWGVKMNRGDYIPDSTFTNFSTIIRSSGNITDVSMGLNGYFGYYVIFKVVEDTPDYKIDIKSAAGIHFDGYLKITGDFPVPGTYNCNEPNLRTQSMTMSVDGYTDFTVNVNGTAYFTKDIELKQIDLTFKQKFAFVVNGDNVLYPGTIFPTDYGRGSGGVIPPLGVNAKIVNSSNVIISIASAPTNSWLDGVTFVIEKQDGTPVSISSGTYYRAGSALSDVLIYYGTVSAPDTEVIKAGDTINLQTSEPLQSGYKLKIRPGSSGGFGVTEVTLSTLLQSNKGVLSELSPYQCSITIAEYQDFSITGTENFNMNLRAVYTPPLDLFDYPISLNEEWWANSTLKLSGSYDGSADVTGIPDKWKEEMGMNETFPIDFKDPKYNSGIFKNGNIGPATYNITLPLKAVGTKTIKYPDGTTEEVYIINIRSEPLPVYTGYPLSGSFNRIAQTSPEIETNNYYSPKKGFFVSQDIPSIPGSTGVTQNSITTEPLTEQQANDGMTAITTNPDRTKPAGLPIGLIVIFVVVIAVVIIAVVLIYMRKKKGKPATVPPPQPPQPGQPIQPPYQPYPPQPYPEQYPSQYPPQYPQQPQYPEQPKYP